MLAGAAGAINAARLGLSWAPERSSREYAEHRGRIAQIVQTRGISLSELRTRLLNGAAVIDVREAPLFEESHLDAGALGSPVPTLNMLPETAGENLQRLHGLLQFSDSIVLYCNSRDCDYAKDFYIELEKLGYIQAGFPDVRIYLDGWEGILGAKLPVTRGADAWQPDGPFGHDSPNDAAEGGIPNETGDAGGLGDEESQPDAGDEPTTEPQGAPETP